MTFKSKTCLIAVIALVTCVAIYVIIMMLQKSPGRLLGSKGIKNMFEFPKLTGEYGVGTMARHVVDYNRKEPFNLNAQRELMVYVWYPAKLEQMNPHIVYRADKAARDVLIRAGFPEEGIKEFDTTYSHAVPNAPLEGIGAPYPIILFSHGYVGTWPVDLTAFCEELASHGYLVASVAHTYYAAMTSFPDGRQITPPAALVGSFPNDKAQKLWTNDEQCALDYLIKINADEQDQFHNFFDTNRIGIIGYSMGGSTAFRLCLNDSRFKIGISLDASPWSQDVAPAELEKPFLFIFAEQTVKDLKKSDEELAKQYGAPVEMITGFRSVSQRQIRADVIIPNATHGAFTDYSLIKEMPFFKNGSHAINFKAMCGTADGRSTIQLINKEVVKFFEKNL
jgi:dienelactone hydrolase